MTDMTQLPPDVEAAITEIDRELAHRAKHPKSTGGQVIINERHYLAMRAYIVSTVAEPQA